MNSNYNKIADGLFNTLDIPGEIIIKRKSEKITDNYLSGLNSLIRDISVNIKNQKIEQNENNLINPGIVDFANPDIHFCSIIPTATQEELLFIARPDYFITLCFTERLNDTEAILLEKAPMISYYQGYQDTFKFNVGNYNINKYEDINEYNKNCCNIIVIESCFEGQFKHNVLLKDINKAFVGFYLNYQSEYIQNNNTNNEVWINTGNWGCGCFGGDFVLKFLQQLISATLGNVNLNYCIYRNEEAFNEITNLYSLIRTKNNLKIKDIWNLLVKNGKNQRDNYLEEEERNKYHIKIFNFIKNYKN